MSHTLDHLVINTHYALDEAVTLFTDLGFTLTPRGYHTLGSINHLIVFNDAYLELIGLPVNTDKIRQEILDSPVGLDGFVLSSSDIQKTYDDLVKSKIHVQPIQRFSRPVELDDSQIKDARFEVVRTQAGEFAAGRVYFCHHETPELVYRPAWQSHKNKAQFLTGLTVVTADKEHTILQYERLGELNKDFQLNIVDQSELLAQSGQLAGIGGERAERFAQVTLSGVDIVFLSRQAAHLKLPMLKEEQRLLLGIPAFNVVLECYA